MYKDTSKRGQIREITDAKSLCTPEAVIGFMRNIHNAPEGAQIEISLGYSMEDQGAVVLFTLNGTTEAIAPLAGAKGTMDAIEQSLETHGDKLDRSDLEVFRNLAEAIRRCLDVADVEMAKIKKMAH